MIVQVVSPSKLAIAFYTWEGFLILVNQIVSLELIGVRELGVTHTTWIWSLACMYSHVSPEVGNLNKVSITVFTVIGFLSRV